MIPAIVCRTGPKCLSKQVWHAGAELPVTIVDQAGLAIVDAVVPPAIGTAIDVLPIDALLHFRIEGPVALAVDWLDILSRTPGLVWAQRWTVADVAIKARGFAELTGASRLALKLEVISDNACRKLHYDYVAHRIVCTYRGPGTQWLRREHEAELGDERDTVPDTWLEVVPRFASALFTGRLAPGARPVLHRSPPIAGTGMARLVLTINEPFSGCHAA